MKIDENTAMAALERACPGLNYILILHNPATREVVQVSNVPPDIQKRVLEQNLKTMENTEPEIIRGPRTKTND